MKLIPLAAAAALSLAAGASLAQPAAPTGAAPGPRAEARHWQRPDPAQMAERHAQHLRDALQLRPDQEPALRALVASMQPPAGETHRMHEDRDAMRGLSTPQRLDRMQSMMAEHEARFREHADAIRRFYAQLTPTQQKAFDAMPMMGHMGGGMGRMHGMHGEHGGGMKHGPGMPGGQPPAPPPGR